VNGLGLFRLFRRKPTAEQCGTEEREPSAIASPSPAPAPPAASAAFLGACRDTRKAWHGTSMLAKCNPQTVAEARRTLETGDEHAIVALLTEMAGPAATPAIQDAFGPTAHRHLELAGIAGRLLVRGALDRRVQGQMLDMERVKQAAAAWIDSGDVGSAFDESCRTALRRVALLLADARCDDVARLRLTVLAPLAAPVETLRVMSQLGQSLVDLMATTNAAARSTAAAAHQWMRAHPDFKADR